MNQKKSVLRRILRRVAYWVVMAVFFVPSRFGKKMTEIPEVENAYALPGFLEGAGAAAHEEVEFWEPGTGLALRGTFVPGRRGQSPSTSGQPRGKGVRPFPESRQVGTPPQRLTPLSAKCSVIFCHGLTGTRMQLGAQAQFVHSLGHDVLMFDMRGHGASEGDFTSLGYFERHDVLAACGYLRERRGAKGIVLYGFSLGAVAAVMAAAEDEGVLGVVAESPYSSLEEIVAHKAREHYHVPKWPLVTLSLWATEVRRGFDRREVDLTKALPRLEGKEALLVASRSDKTIPVEMTRELKDYLCEGHEYWEVTGAEHGMIFSGEHRGEFERRLRGLLDSCDARLTTSRSGTT
jgi:hypothetical protein